MSIQPASNGDGYRVRWRENGKLKSRNVKTWDDAVLLDADVKRRKALGPHLMRELDRSTLTLDQYLDDGFEAYAATLAKRTRMQYAWAVEHHLAELLDEPLVDLDVPRLMRHQRHLIETGRTANTVRAVLTRLSGILTAALHDGLIPVNPVRGMKRIAADTREEVRPLSPVELEALLAVYPAGRSRVLVVLCGYLGLRPQEARKALWSDIQGSTLWVSRARTKKAAARTRRVDLPAVAMRDLNAWRLESGLRGDDPIIGNVGPNNLAAWTERRLKPDALKTLGRTDVTLYTLRHTHASMLHYCGATTPEAARRLGHTGVVHIDRYAHVIEQIGRARYNDLDELIAAARSDLLCPQSALETAKAP